MSTEKGKYVLRSTYQKVVEENKRLLADIKIFCTDLTPERIKLTFKWRERFAKDKALNELIITACKEYIKDHPEYDITSPKFIKPINHGK